MSDQGDLIQLVYRQTMLPNGFMRKIRENEVDRNGFSELLTAVKSLTQQYCMEESISRLLVACLNEAAYEIENTVEHYSDLQGDLGRDVHQMAEELRQAINDLLWSGLERYYEGIEET